MCLWSHQAGEEKYHPEEKKISKNKIKIFFFCPDLFFHLPLPISVAQGSPARALVNLAIKATECSAFRVNIFCHCWSPLPKSHTGVGHVPGLSGSFWPLLCLQCLHTDGMDAQSLTSCPEHPLLAPSLPILQSVCAGQGQSLDQC